MDKHRNDNINIRKTLFLCKREDMEDRHGKLVWANSQNEANELYELHENDLGRVINGTDLTPNEENMEFLFMFSLGMV